MLRNCVWTLLIAAINLAAAPGFTRDIKPVLQKNCQGCHQPSSLASGLDLTSFEAFQKCGKRGPAFIAGKPDESPVIRYVSGVTQPRMPLGQPALKSEDIDLLRAWILDGAKDDSQPDPTPSAGPIV